jgi:RHS repeat-associated protein
VKKICAGVDGSYERYGSSYTVTFNLPEGVNERTYAVKLKVRDDEYQYGYETVYVTVKRPKHFYFYVKDHLGSTRAVVDEAGDVVEAYDYYPFGLQSRSYKEKGDPLTKETFTGKEQDTESNLHYFGARFYDAGAGRWLSVDPLADQLPDNSPFVYCGSDPINRFDPDGLLDIKLKFSKESKFSENQQQEIAENIKKTFENAGVEDVNVIVNPSLIDHVLTFFGDNISINFDSGSGIEYGDGSVRAGEAEKGSRTGNVYEQPLVDDPDTPQDESVQGASNAASHEAGHASPAALGHSIGPDGTDESDDGSVMHKRLQTNKRRDFNEEDSERLRENHN